MSVVAARSPQPAPLAGKSKRSRTTRPGAPSNIRMHYMVESQMTSLGAHAIPTLSTAPALDLATPTATDPMDA
jgi:hypothetical protein